MKELEHITAIEDRYVGESGEPVLGQAFELLASRWRSGFRDRETALRLLFLAWYSCAEPPFLTGLSGSSDSESLFGEVFHVLGGEQSEDAEFCYVSGTMADLFPWCLGNESLWQHTAKRMLKRSHALQPQGFQPSQFAGRGAYGKYFAHMVSCDRNKSG